MSGNNTVWLCPQAMNEALEFYLNTQVLNPNHPVTVTSVTEQIDCGMSTFKISISPLEIINERGP